MTRKKVFHAQALDGIESDEIARNEARFKSIVEGAGGLVISTNRKIIDPSDRGLRNSTVEEMISRVLGSDILYVDMSIPNRNYPGCIHEMSEAKKAGMPIILYVGENTGYETRNHLLYLADDRVFTSPQKSIDCLLELLE